MPINNETYLGPFLPSVVSAAPEFVPHITQIARSGVRSDPAAAKIQEKNQFPFNTLTATGTTAWQWFFSERFCRVHAPGDNGKTGRDVRCRSLLRLLAPNERHRLIEQWRRLIAGLDDRFDITLHRDDYRSDTGWRVRAGVTFRTPDGKAGGIAGTQEPIEGSGGRRMRTQMRANAFVASRDAMLVVDENWTILEANRAFIQLNGSALSEVLGSSLRAYVEAEALRFAPGDITECDGHHEGILRDTHHSHLPVELTLSHFTLDESQDVHFIAALRDISARKRSELELKHLASIDTLTQLPNRATLQYTLKQRLDQLDPSSHLTVLFINLDGFKYINDSLGHQAGDTLLRSVVKRLRATLRGQDLVARWGDDEFVVVVDVRGDEPLANRIAHRLLHALAQPVSLKSHRISVTASIGMVHAPRDGRDSETLLTRANVAMYTAKSQGKNAVVVYHDKLVRHDLEQISLLSQLREALTRNTLNFVVQPKFDGQSQVIGVELLARWHIAGYGHVPPSTFVPLAEHNGMASMLGKLAIEHAALFAARLAAGGHALPVAVNISALHVMDKGLADTLRDACHRHAIRADQIELEVTESVFLENTNAPEARIEHLRHQGFRVAMDDFGSGYSSLGYLKRLPFDTIKIDRSFMLDLEADSRARDLLAGILGLCNLLGMETVAEGVETRAQWQLLQELGVKQYQGYYLGRPMAVEQFVERLADAKNPLPMRSEFSSQ